MVATSIQVIAHRFIHKRYEKLHLISLALILVLGGATLFLQDPSFIKWKPTVIYWVCSLAFLISFWIGKKTLVQKMFDTNIQLPKAIWLRLNIAWILFFILMGAFNLYIAYHFDTNTWVNFKLFGGAGLTLVFVFLQALYLTRHSHNEPITNSRSN